MGDPISAHQTEILAMDAIVHEDRLLAVTGAEDGTAQTWDLTHGVATGAPMTGHEGRITAVATTLLQGRPVAVTAGKDSVVRVWSLAS